MSEPSYWSEPASKERPNEDAVFFSDGVAVVVDGAGLPRSMTAGCHHSVAWYSHELARAFGTALGDLGLTMPQALRQAITEVSQRHGDCDLANGSPSATVAAWRLRPPEVEYLVLCDASVVVATVDDVVEITDDRLSALMAERLDQFTGAAEGGTGSAVTMLEARGAILQSSRNFDGGFWCCQIDPTAVDHALVGSRLISDMLGIVIATEAGRLPCGTHARRASRENGQSTPTKPGRSRARSGPSSVPQTKQVQPPKSAWRTVLGQP